MSASAIPDIVQVDARDSACLHNAQMVCLDKTKTRGTAAVLASLVTRARAPTRAYQEASILVMLAARIMCAITITVTCCSQIVAWQPILSQLVVPRELGGEAAFQRLRWTVPIMDADVVGVVLIAASE